MANQDKKQGNNARPSWDDYFMEVANAISKRATCDRGKSGCVIAKDRQLIVSGYVGSPTGFQHCDEAEHQIKKVTHEDGEVTEHCMRTVHAEQNAICQAARIGVSISGYSRSGSIEKATRPKVSNSKFITIAKTGRLTLVSVIFMV